MPTINPPLTLSQLTGSCEPTLEVLRAFNHVRSKLPTIARAVFSYQGRWYWTDEDGGEPRGCDWTTEIDIGILEDAVDSIDNLGCLPAVFEVVELDPAVEAAAKLSPEGLADTARNTQKLGHVCDEDS